MAASRPNVLFMPVDDLRPQMACYGRDQMLTPNFDHLASGGVLFERNLCQQPICMASRASFMTGRFPDRDRIYSCEPVGKLMPDIPTLNQHFAQQGYDVSAVGKIYHYPEDNRSQFGDKYGQPADKAFGRGYINDESQRIIEANIAEHYQTVEAAQGRGPAFEQGIGTDEDYPDGAAAAWAIEQLHQRSGSSDPFFLGVGWKKPHLPFSVPKKYWDLYNPADFTKE